MSVLDAGWESETVYEVVTHVPPGAEPDDRSPVSVDFRETRHEAVGAAAVYHRENGDTPPDVWVWELWSRTERPTNEDSD